MTAPHGMCCTQSLSPRVFYARTNRKRGTSMKIIKRNGSEATFDIVKIIAAVTKGQ